MSSIKTCRLCNSTEISDFFFFNHLFTKNKWKKYYCNNCTFINYNPIKKIDYHSGYRQNNINSEYLIDPWMIVSFLRWKNIYRLIKNKKISKILDYGGYNGSLLFALKKKLETFKEGTVADLDINGLKFAKNIGFDTINLKRNKIIDKYDLILIVQVLEHIIDPRKLLINLKKNLKKNGMIYLEVPNVFRFPMSDLAHINDFNMISLKKCINLLDYKILKCGYTQTDNFSNKLEYYYNSKKEIIYFLIKKNSIKDKKKIEFKIYSKKKIISKIYLGQTYLLLIVSIRLLIKSIKLLKNSIKYVFFYICYLIFYLPFNIISFLRSRYKI